MQLIMGATTMPKRGRVKRVTPFTEWLTDQIRQAGISQAEFARRAGLPSAAVVSRWVSGESKPTVDMVARIARALQVDIDYVMEKAGYRPAPLVGATSERGGLLAGMVARVNWDDETRYTVTYRMIRGFLEEDRLTAEATVTPPQG